VIAQKLRDKGRLTPEQYLLVNELRGLRNRAVHGREFDVSSGEALEYARLARMVVETVHP
jgi:uncharacterized protein YutE (UPF0331/DUF86 family)